MNRMRWIALAGMAALSAGGAALGAERPAPPPREQMPDQPVTARREDLGTAVSSPAEDLNLRKTAIPDVLVRATANPYDMRTMDQCPTVGAEIVRLDAALGPDADRPPPEDTRTVNQKRGNTAASVLRTGVEAVTPYRGVIRRITGATAYEKRMQLAIEAGFARRGFLKGLGMKLNCAPPAAPAWFKPAATRTPVRQPVRKAR